MENRTAVDEWPHSLVLWRLVPRLNANVVLISVSLIMHPGFLPVVRGAGIISRPPPRTVSQSIELSTFEAGTINVPTNLSPGNICVSSVFLLRSAQPSCCYYSSSSCCHNIELLLLALAKFSALRSKHNSSRLGNFAEHLDI